MVKRILWLVGAITLSFGIYFFYSAHFLKTPDYVSTNTLELYEAAKPPPGLDMAIAALMAEDQENFPSAAKYYYQVAKLKQNPDYAKKALQTALKTDDTKLALESSLLWTQISPTDNEALHSHGYLLMLNGQHEEALAYYEKIFSKKALYLNLYTPLLPPDLKDDSLKEKLLSWENAAANNPVRLTIVALLWSEAGNNAEAQRLIEKALKANPENIQAMGIKTQFMLDDGDVEGAKDYLSKMSSLHNNDPYLHLLMGDLYLKTRDVSNAKSHYLSIVDNKDYTAQASFELGRVAMLEGDNVQAKKYFLTASEFTDTQQKAYLFLGELARTQQLNEEAISWFMRVTDSPYYFPARIQAALILEQAKQYTEALAILEDVTPTTIEQVKKVVVLQSTIYIETNRLEEAYLLTTKLLVLLPEDKDLLYLRSQIALGLQQEESAETDLTQLLKQEPDNVEVLNTLGYLLLNNKDRLEEARTYLLKALSLSPEDPDILDSVGWMYFQQADFSKALTYLSSAYAKEPNNAEIAAHYGEALWESGHQEKAKNIWKKALQNEPNNATLLKIMERTTSN